MKYLKKFATESDVFLLDSPNIVLVEDTKRVLYNVRPNGVFIQHINNKLYSADAWSAQGFAKEEANGVAVIDSACSFVISKDGVAGNATNTWGGSGLEITNTISAATIEEAVLDYDGLNNTLNIVNDCRDYKDDAGIIGAPSAEACKNYIFPNGQVGYLPSMGELQVAYNWKTDIDAAMALIGKPVYVGTYLWSSTRYSQFYAWQLRWPDGGTLRQSRSKFGGPLPFAPLNL